MSFILDALKKLDEKRSAGNVPNLSTVHTVGMHRPRKRPAWPYILFIALLINAVILSVWLLRSDSGDSKPETLSAAREPSREIAEPTVKNISKSEPELTPPAAVQRDNMPAIKQDMAALPKTENALVEPATEAVKKSAEPVAEEAVPYDEPSVSDEADTQYAPEETLELNPSVEELEALKKIIKDEQDVAGSMIIQDEEEPAERLINSAEQEIRLYSELPAELKKEIPKFTIAGHIYSGNPSSRMANINGSIVREGDTVTGQLKVREITETGIIFQYRDLDFRARAF